MDFKAKVIYKGEQIEVSLKQFAAIRDYQALYVVTGSDISAAMIEGEFETWVFLSKEPKELQVIEFKLSNLINEYHKSIDASKYKKP